MQYRIFGKSGIEISEIVFGCGYVGGLMIQKDKQTCLKAVQKALDSGINWFDTAASYGNGTSEESLGTSLAQISQKTHVSTKFSYDPSLSESAGSQIRRSLEASLSRLKMNSVDLYQLHNPVFGSPAPVSDTGFRGILPADVLGIGGVLEILQKLREEGLFRLIGMTALGDAKACIEVIRTGSFDSAQVYCNLLNPSAIMKMPQGWTGHDFGGFAEVCIATETAIMNIRVFAAGVIASNVRHGREMVITDQSRIDQEEKRVESVFLEIGTEFGSRSQTAVRFSLAQNQISCVVIGLAEMRHLYEALEAQEMGPLPEDGLERIRKIYPSFSN